MPAGQTAQKAAIVSVSQTTETNMRRLFGWITLSGTRFAESPDGAYP